MFRALDWVLREDVGDEVPQNCQQTGWGREKETERKQKVGMPQMFVESWCGRGMARGGRGRGSSVEAGKSGQNSHQGQGQENWTGWGWMGMD